MVDSRRSFALGLRFYGHQIVSVEDFQAFEEPALIRFASSFPVQMSKTRAVLVGD